MVHAHSISSLSVANDAYLLQHVSQHHLHLHDHMLDSEMKQEPWLGGWHVHMVFPCPLDPRSEDSPPGELNDAWSSAILASIALPKSDSTTDLLQYMLSENFASGCFLSRVFNQELAKVTEPVPIVIPLRVLYGKAQC